MNTKLQAEKDWLIQKIQAHIEHHKTTDLELKRFEKSGDLEGIIVCVEALKTIAYANSLMEELDQIITS